MLSTMVERTLQHKQGEYFILIEELVGECSQLKKQGLLIDLCRQSLCIGFIKI